MCYFIQAFPSALHVSRVSRNLNLFRHKFYPFPLDEHENCDFLFKVFYFDDEYRRVFEEEFNVSKVVFPLNLEAPWRAMKYGYSTGAMRDVPQNLLRFKNGLRSYVKFVIN